MASCLGLVFAVYPPPPLSLFSTRIQVHLHVSSDKEGTGQLTHAHLLSSVEYVEKMCVSVHALSNLHFKLTFFGIIIYRLSVN